jgi:hypothetical protein
MHGNTTSPDLTEAARFLTALDPTATKFCFQTFDDSKARRDRTLTKILHGTLAEHAAELERLNQKGAGIFVTVNETDGAGRMNENITRVRALYVDLDGAPLGPVQAHKVHPHIVIETSPGRWHAYWRVDGMALEHFTPAQEALSEAFDGDRSVKALPHVMRLPGFFHRKAEPYMAHIIETHDAPPCPAAWFERAEQEPRRASDDVEIDPDKAIAALDAMPNDADEDWVVQNRGFRRRCGRWEARRSF